MFEMETMEILLNSIYLLQTLWIFLLIKVGHLTLTGFGYHSRCTDVRDSEHVSVGRALSIIHLSTHISHVFQMLV